MNRRSSGLSLSKALVGFLHAKAAEGLRPRTLQIYEHRLKQWAEYASDADLAQVSAQDICGYLAWLRTDH